MSQKDLQFIERALAHPWMFWVYCWKWPRIVRQACAEYDLLAKERDAAKAAHERSERANKIVRDWIHVTHRLSTTPEAIRAIFAAGKRLSILLVFFVVTSTYGQAPPYLRNQWTTNANPLALKVVSTNGVHAATNVWELDFTNTATVTVSAVSNANKVMVSFTGSASSGSSLTNALLHAGPTNGSVGALVLTAGNGVTLTTSGTNRIAAIDTNVVAEISDLLWTNDGTAVMIVADTNRVRHYSTQTVFGPTNRPISMTNAGIMFMTRDEGISPGSYGRVSSGAVGAFFYYATNCFVRADDGAWAGGLFDGSANGGTSNSFARAFDGSHAGGLFDWAKDSYADARGGSYAGVNFRSAQFSFVEADNGSFAGGYLFNATNSSIRGDIGSHAGGYINSGATNASIYAISGIAIGVIPASNERIRAQGDVAGALAIGRDVASTNNWTFGIHYTNTVPLSLAVGANGTTQFRAASNSVVIRTETAPTVGQILTATDTSGTVGWSNAPASSGSSLTNALLHAGPTNGSVGALILTAGTGIDLSTSGTNRAVAVTGELTNWVNISTNAFAPAAGGAYIATLNGFGTNTTVNNNGGAAQFLVGATAEAANDYMKVRVTNHTATFNYGTSSSTNGTFGTWDNTHTFGWNIAAGGGRVVASEPAYGETIEADYFGMMEVYNQFFATNGLSGRPEGWLFDRTGGSSVYELSASTINFYLEPPTNTAHTNLAFKITESDIVTYKKFQPAVPVLFSVNVTNSARVEFLPGSLITCPNNLGGSVRFDVTNGTPYWVIGGVPFKFEVTNAPAYGNLIQWSGDGVAARRFHFRDIGETINDNHYIAKQLWNVQNSAGTYVDGEIRAANLYLFGGLKFSPAFSGTLNIGSTSLSDTPRNIFGSNIFAHVTLGTPTANVGTLSVTNNATTGGNLIVSGAITNSALTASTVLAVDSTKEIVSIANGAGVLTNDGAGVLGWKPLSDFVSGGGGIASIFTNNVLAGGPGLTELGFTNTATVTWAATTNAGRVTMAATSAAGAQTPWASDINAAAFSLTNFGTMISFTNGSKIGATAINTLTFTNAHLHFSADNTFDVGGSGANRPRDLNVGRFGNFANDVTTAGAFTLSPASQVNWWSGSYRGRIGMPGVGIHLLDNGAGDYTRLDFGGTTAAFPAFGKTAGNGHLRMQDATGATSTNSLIFGNTVDTTASTGMTMNRQTGRVRLSAGNQTYLVTNNLATANSIVTATVNSDDTTAVSVKAIPAAGMITLKANAATTADTDISFFISSP